jgi:predicted membrane protein
MDRGRVWLGAVLTSLGAVFLVQQFGYANAGAVLAMWWPLAVIALGLASIGTRTVFGPAIVIGIGVVLLAITLGWLAATFNILWPIVAVVIGAGLLAGGLGVRRRPVLDEDWVDQVAFFSGLDIPSTAPHFRGGSLTAVFGGFTLDLHAAQLAPEGARLQATTILGGLTIVVPRGWRVTISGLPVFGGFSDKTTASGPAPEGAPHLQVDAVCLFGGVEVKLYEAGKPQPLSAAA